MIDHSQHTPPKIDKEYKPTNSVYLFIPRSYNNLASERHDNMEIDRIYLTTGRGNGE